MSERIGDWMQTFTGKQFWPLDPRPEDICIEDIAHALANQCRFAGHVREFYSVAQHSVIVAHNVPKGCARWALLHDATEAYLVDLPRPVKRFSTIGAEYQIAEIRLMNCIQARFNLPPIFPAEVRRADDIVLMTEKRDLMGPSPAKWRENAEPLRKKIVPCPPAVAKQIFLACAKGLDLK